MNNFYRFLRYAMFLAVGMVCMMPAMAQHPFTLTTASDITNGTQHYYLMQSADRTTFYAIPHSDAEDSKVSTTSIPNATMRWYFMDAGIESGIQYYYIVNSTGRCLYHYDDNHDGIRIKNTYADLSSLSDDELNKYKYYLTQTGSYYYIHPKDAPSLYLNKRGTNHNYSNGYYIKASEFTDAPSKWQFVAVDQITWPQPFTVSTDVEKHYYKFQNVTSTSFYLSNSGEWTTVSNTGDEENIWYLLEAGVDATYSNCHYYFIVNAVTNKYLYYTGDTGNDVAKVLDYNSEEGDNYRFLIVDAAYKPNNNYATAYTIVPKLRQAYFSGKDSFAPIAMEDNSHLLLKNDRGTDNYDSHWTLVETEYVGDIVVAPTITNNYDGYISLSTTTPGATIYYTTDGTTPDNTSTAYSSAFSLGDATVIKAIAYLDSDYSDVSIYNVPKYTTPTISFDNNISKVTITCADATGIYYTTDGSTPTISSDAYSEPFPISSATTVKAIATHSGYLNSDVATKYIQGNNYSQNYLTFNVLTAGTIVWKAFNETTKTIEYSINGGEWISITSSSSGESFTVDKNDVIRFRGTNSTYATSKSNYSGFEGGSATFNIEGNIHSLLYGDDFASNNSLTNSTYQFCSLFKKALVISAENLILPATTLKDYCYRALFSWCTTLEKAPVLPATTLATGCYWYMFEECPITTAPELNATTLVKECYGNMFTGCTSLNYIKCLAANNMSATDCLKNWVTNVSATGTFVKKESVTWSTGTSGIPTGWLAVDDGTPDIPTISCSGIDIELICGTEGADIYYRLDPNGDYEQYMETIIMTGDTFIECYSEKEGKTSATISQTCEYDDRTIYEYSNQSFASWTYGGNTITTPYSVNAIDGHSSNYAKGTFNFETDVNLRSQQPTYLWFQHADQSASIYVDNNLVEKHWGGYNAFFVDITDHVHKGTNHIKVALKNNEGNVLAPYAGDFNFNATLGNVKLFTSPCLPSMSYGYDGFHITSTVSSDEATINVKTTIPTGASVVCTIIGDNCNYSDTQTSDGTEMTFTTTITSPHLWNGTIDPYLYNVKLEIYHDDELYHSYERPYGLRFYEYVINETINENTYTGFLLNGQPYLLRGVCVHDDLEGKANALNDADYTQEFNIITDLGCNFLRLAHYPHPKEVYDKCDQLGIIVQTEAPWVNKSTINETEDYWTHLEGQCADMVNQHYNHPCILFWGVGNEINTNYTSTTDGKIFVKSKIESYRNTIRSLMPNAWVGYTVSHGTQDGLGTFNNPTVDWIGQNIYVGWYIDKTSNNPTNRLNTAINNASGHSVPCAFSEYGCGGTRTCHSDDFMSTTTTGNNDRHDIEYQMWLHEGHIAAIKNKPELLFSSQWQLFDIAVSNRAEGYKVCWDGETVTENEELKRLNNKGLVERDHKTKKDTYYLYKAWWNQSDKFVHICGKDYLKTENRVIKCYTNDGNSLKLYVNDDPVPVETVTVTDNIATFTARNFTDGDVITVSGDTSDDTFTIHNYGDNVFITEGDWNTDSNWSGNAVPNNGSDVLIAAKATIPANNVVNAGEISIIPGATLTIADGGQLYHTNAGVTATVQKDITAYTVLQTQGETKTDGWYLIGYSFAGNGAVDEMDNLLENEYDLFYYDEPTHYWRNYKYDANSFANLETARGYLYANSQDVTIGMKGTLNASNAKVIIPLDYTTTAGSLIGFNLVGNPFAHNVIAYTGNHVAEECYRVNDTRTDLIVDNISNENPLKTGEGFFVKATDENASITFNSGTKDEMKKTERIKLEIRENDQLIDRLIVKREGKPLKKITLNENGTKVFAMHNNQKMAVIPIEGNELPVYFETDKNGTYTISLSTENTTLYYLHLIDNITNDDVDLLTTPSYSFNAWTMDDSDRFKLVFICGEADDDNKTFAFINNGDIIITADVENATLQVIDVMGRMIISRNVNVLGHVPTNGMASGTYILRLISGDNVMTQKIMIR